MSIVERLTEATKLVLLRLNPTPDLKPLEHPDGSGRQLVAIADGYKLSTQEGPEVSVARHAFTHIGDFGRWLQENAPAGQPSETQVLIGDHRIVAQLFKGWGEGPLVTCRLEHHPAYKLLQALLYGPHEVVNTIELVRALADHVAPIRVKGSDNTLDGAQVVVGQLQQLTFKRNEQVELAHTAAGLSFRVEGAKQVTSPLLDELVFKVPVFAGVTNPQGGEFTYTVRVFVNASVPEQGPPRLRFSAPQLPLVVEEARGDLHAYVLRAVGEGFLVARGEHESKTVPLSYAARQASSVPADSKPAESGW